MVLARSAMDSSNGASLMSRANCSTTLLLKSRLKAALSAFHSFKARPDVRQSQPPPLTRASRMVCKSVPSE